MPSQLLFLPGASGNTRFWQPVADLLAFPGTRRLFGWPGFGATPPDPAVNGMDDLIDRVVKHIDRPTALIAQSMGGIIAVQAALRCPGLVTHLVLTVTSGGIDAASLGAQDWRPAFQKANPSLPTWFSDFRSDLEPQFSAVEAPVLLLWGDADPISPVAVGNRLARLLPCAELHVVPGGDHDLANTRAAVVAPLIDRHLVKAPAYKHRPAPHATP